MSVIKHGYSRGAVAHNIRVVQQMGAPHNEAVAMALRIRDAELRKKMMRQRYSNPGMDNMPTW
jgi:hypothetical protein